MTIANLFMYPKFRGQDSSGNALSGGKLYSYAEGTSTPKTTYSDAARTVPNANPVILDTNGEALVYIDGLYKFVLKDSNDVTQWTVDQVSGSVVELTGDQTIAGVKTFSSSPVVPTPTTDMQASTKLYADTIKTLLAAKGDLLYTTAANVLAALNIGAANTKLFVNAAGDAPEYASGVNIISGARDLTAATGDVAYTGVGFKSSAIICLALKESDPIFSVGFSNGSSHHSVGQSGTGNAIGGNFCIFSEEGGTVRQTAIVKTFDADGFTLTWTKTNSPTGTLYFYILAIR